MQAFIRVTEIWTPNDTGTALTLADGSYGPLQEFRELSSRETFAFGEGLPGKAWELARPVVFKTFDDTVFQRTEAAHRVGLTAGIALPILAGEFIKAVLVFLCGDQQQPSGAIELWQDDGQSGLGLVEGYYGDLEHFEWLSKSIRFPRGRGLPGMVWETARPAVLGNLADSNSFMRSRGAAEAGITAGIGIPVDSGVSADGVDSVLTFLSSKGTPIARRFEVWRPDADRQALQFDLCIADSGEQPEPADPERRIDKGQGTIGGVWASGVPAINTDVDSEPVWHRGNRRYQGLESLLAIPIIQKGRLNAVVVLYN